MSAGKTRFDSLSINADLSLEFGRRRCRFATCERDVLAEVPDLATGFVLLRSALPRGLRRRVISALVDTGLKLRVVLRGRRVLVVGGRDSFLSIFGWPNTRVHLLALARAAIGR